MNAATAAAVISDERWLDCRVAIKAGKVLAIRSTDGFRLFVSGLGTTQKAKFVETAAGRIYLNVADQLHIFDDIRSTQHFVFESTEAAK